MESASFHHRASLPSSQEDPTEEQSRKKNNAHKPEDDPAGWMIPLHHDNDNNSSRSISSEQQHNHHNNIMKQMLEEISNVLQAVDQQLEQVDEAALSSGIRRICHNMADGIGQVAHQLEEHQQDETKRRALAQACMEDARYYHRELYLTEDERNDDGPLQQLMPPSTTTTTISNDKDPDLARMMNDLANMNENDWTRAIQAAGNLLRDVEETLRTLDKDDADELASVAVTVARLFVLSLQSIQEQILSSPQLQRQPRSTVTIEEIQEEDEDASSTHQHSRSRSSPSSHVNRRMKVLWPPLGPEVAKACDWGKDEAMKRPLLTAALGITLWPVALTTLFIGTPVVVFDSVLQRLYDNFQDTPIVQGIEMSAAQAFQTGKLAFVCGKLTAKQSWRLAQRQLNRHGGVEQIVGGLAHACVDRVTHPVETAGMAWEGLTWGFDRVREFVEHMNDQERDRVVQELQH